jgi:PmbA protein
MASHEGAEAEIFILERDLKSIRLFKDEVVEAQDLVEEGIAIRVVKDGGIGFSVTNILERDQLTKAFKSALRMARSSNRIPNWSQLPKSDDTKASPHLNLYDKELASSSAEDVVSLAMRMSKRVVSHDGAAYSLTGVLMVLSEKFSVINSNGLEHLSEPSSILHSRIIVDEKKNERYMAVMDQFSTRKLRDFRPEEEADKVVSEVSDMARLPGKPVSSGRYDLILTPEAVGAFVSYLVSPMITGRSIQMGVSCFTGMLRKVIAVDSFSLIDDGRVDGGLGSALIDDEGTPTKSTPIIENGVLKNLLYDALTACQVGVASTGNGRRLSETLGRTYLTPPEPHPSNLIVKNGDLSPDELIKETSKGVLVHSIDYTFPLVPEQGYFSMMSSVPALVVDNGEIVGQTKDVTVSGELREALRKISGIGKYSQQSIHIGSLAATCPHLLMKDMVLSKTA